MPSKNSDSDQDGTPAVRVGGVGRVGKANRRVAGDLHGDIINGEIVPRRDGDDASRD